MPLSKANQEKITQIIKYRAYGFSFEEIGKKVGLSKSRTHKLWQIALQELKDYLKPAIDQIIITRLSEIHQIKRELAELRLDCLANKDTREYKSLSMAFLKAIEVEMSVLTLKIEKSDIGLSEIQDFMEFLDRKHDKAP
jgi:DNA-binding transcriptional MerR regulator